MKYIKTYENYDDVQWEIGDYVMLQNKDFIDSKTQEKVHVNNEVKIIGKSPYNMYKVQYIDGWISNSHVLNIHRRMTLKEIEDYEMKLNAKKYNL